MNVESNVITGQTVTESNGTNVSVKTASVNRDQSPAKALGVTNILVAVDFSDCSKAALDYAAVLARNVGATLTLVHVVEPYVYPEDLSAGLTIEQVDARWMRTAREKLEELRRQTSTEKILSNVIVTMGPAWRQIVETAKSRHADLIVTGTHGYTGLTHVVLGSTAERVVRHAGRPVLVVPAPPTEHNA
jgi:nucleotide-binding universal stress UspA family protein